MIIRRERADDRPEIFAVVSDAFAGGAEIQLLRGLFAAREYIRELSLVAESEQGTILGYTIATRAWVGESQSLGLGPLAVQPGYQNQGVGSALMAATIAGANELGESTLVVLGSFEYFPQFGFVPADSLGITSPEPSWGSHFMALALAAYQPGLHGHFRYAQPFNSP